LRKHGLALIELNFSCRYGEIDLILQDQAYLVFVEVRYRKSSLYGGAIASIDARKQGKLRRSAEYYLIKRKKPDCACRFDILCIDGNLDKPQFNWVQNAF